MVKKSEHSPEFIQGSSHLPLFIDKVAILDLPGGLWALLNVGVGGYAAGRSGEKIAKIVKGLG